MPLTLISASDSTPDPDGDSAEIGGPNLDDPTKDWDNKQHFKSIAEVKATGKSRIMPAEGKYLEGRADDVVEANGEILMHFKKDRAYITQDPGGYFSNAIAHAFVLEFTAGSKNVGTRIEELDLGSGFTSILMVGKSTATVQFGTDDRVIQVVSAPTPQGEALVRRLGRALAKELAEFTKPGSRQPSAPPVTVAVPSTLPETLPVDPVDPHPSKGLDPEPK